MSQSGVQLATGAMACIVTLVGSAAASAQRVTAVPRLNLNQFTGTWYEIARLPTKPEKKCLSDGTVLYAPNDKPRTFQVGTFCKVTGGNVSSFNNAGRQDKQKNGQLKLRHWVFFSTKYWVLAAGPAYDWALVGYPNHKALWILARTPTLDPSTLTQIESQAAAQGFKIAKLLLVPHTTSTYSAEGQVAPGAAELPSQATP